ncbi:sigma-70 family RNA polymerase sigma factor [Kitasatospora sp. NPDC096147]|uniref:sigma-70 family RNA polymerase sigma factor n=1 Tax=Kitasatospora sp. NPDC096147 TaxID=3364093 RepID=UPI0038229D59
MQAEHTVDPEVVSAARAGSDAARERLVAEHLPLVYNVVGRAMNGDPEVDDVVQETMIRVVGGLADLRDPAAFRSWLVAIAMNEVRRAWAARRARPTVSPDHSLEQVVDPAGDFVGLTVLQLGLSGQRREVAEATRWLDERDADLLALWWQEVAGRLTRAELAAALDLSPAYAAVRVQRMKEQLEAGRLVVRALAATPACPELAALTVGWDGRPSALWRKRIVRHGRSCARCGADAGDLVPVQGLLAGLGLVVPPHGLVPHDLLGAAVSWAHRTADAQAVTPPHPGGGAGGSDGGGTLLGAKSAVAGTAVVVAAGLMVLIPYVSTNPGSTPGAAPARPESGPTSAPPARPSSGEPSAPPPVPVLSTQAAPPTVPTARPTPTRSVISSPPPASEQQLVDLVNSARAKQGCRPVRVDPRLRTAARRHAADMAAQHYFGHRDPAGADTGDRITAAGYRWTRLGENLNQHRKTAAEVLNDWLGGPSSLQNVMDCRFTDAGVGIAQTPDGPLWTLDLAAGE